MRLWSSDRSLIAVAIVLALLGATGYNAIRSLRTLTEATNARFAAQSRMAALTEALSTLQDAETGQRGYLITGDDRYLAPYEDATRVLDRRMQRLRDLYAEALQFTPRLDRLLHLVDGKLTELERTVALRRTAGYEPARAVVLTDSGKASMDEIRAVIGDLKGREQTALDTRIREAQERTVSALLAITLSLIASIVVALGATWLFLLERRRRARIRELEATAQQARARHYEDIERAKESLIVALDEVAYRRLPEDKRIDWSGAYRKVLGYDDGAMGHDEARWISRIHPKDYSQVEQALERMRRDRAVFDLEYRFLHANGSWRVLHDRGVPQFDSRGRLYEIIGVMRDVTAMRAVQAEQEALARHLSYILDNMHDGFLVLDRNWTFTHVNHQASELFGRSASDLLGRNAWELFPERIRGTTWHAMQDGRADGQPRQIECHYEQLGRWFEENIFPFDEGVAMFFRDVTERKLAAAERERIQQRIENILASVRDGFVALDGNWIFIYVNEAAAGLMHIPRERLIGGRMWELFAEAMQTPFYEAAMQAMRERIPVRLDNFYPPTERWYRNHIYPTADGISIFFEDISVQKQMEAELAEQRKRAHAFARQLDRVVEHERARIAREIHDELGQAFTALKMDIGWLQRRLGDDDANSSINQRLLSMSGFVDETLDSARRIATELRPPLLDSLGLAAALDAYIRQLAARAGLQAQIDLDADVLPRPEQSIALYRIAQEALTNVARHARAHHVKTALHGDDDSIVLEIADDGQGFDAAAMQKRRLGLLNIRERASLMGGDAEIASGPDGTRVRVRVPAAPPAADVAEAIAHG